MKHKNTKFRKPDKLFDGHLEKPLSKMIPFEKIDYLWRQMVFKYNIKDREKLNK